MSLDISLLERARLDGDKLIARCPACAEQGGDRAGNHLAVFDCGKGAFRCIVDSVGAGGDHNCRIYQLAGLNKGRRQVGRAPLPAIKRKSPFRLLHLPELQAPEDYDFQLIAEYRNWHFFPGLRLLADRKLLFFARVWDIDHAWASWVITDSARKNAQARSSRLHLWQSIGGKKAWSIKGSNAAWPIGAAEIGDRPNVLLCEGQPDFGAALSVVLSEKKDPALFAPVCMTGTMGIHEGALPLFTKRRVLMFLHPDDAGMAAGVRWSQQLEGVGASVRALKFSGLQLRNGKAVKDLADYASLISPSGDAPRRLLGEF